MTADPCLVFHPHVSHRRCEVCGLPSHRHPLAAGRPVALFDPCPTLPNPGWENECPVCRHNWWIASLGLVPDGGCRRMCPGADQIEPPADAVRAHARLVASGDRLA